MTLDVDLEHRLGAFRLTVRFRTSGRLTVLFGPSGSGKTSVANLVAGLSRPARGRIETGGAVLLDTASGLFVPPHRRRIGYVFQDARLFPHLSVRANLLYGRWFTPTSERSTAFEGVVDLLGLGALLARVPATLSGGERQRVAIGRALLASPRLLLMDEPLAALDEARKADVLPFIERLRDEAGIPILYVSHSIREVLRLGTDMVALAEGRVVSTGTPAEVLRRLDLVPATADVEAGSLLDTHVAGHDAAGALTALASSAGTFHVARIEGPVGMPVRLRIRARDVMISLGAPEGLSALNVLEGTVTAIREAGPAGADVVLDCGGAVILARITRRSVAALALRPGARVHAVVKTVSFDRPDAGRPAGGLDP